MDVLTEDAVLPEHARPSAEVLDAVASSCLGAAAVAASWTATPFPYVVGSPATAGLFRVRGTTTDGREWRAFLKVLQHPRHWPLLAQVPAPLREDFLASFPWRAELAAWEPELTQCLPDGLRVPRLHHLADLGDDRLALWMEDVESDPAPWDLPRYERAAGLLGTMAARRSDPAALDACGVPVGYGLRMYVEGRVRGALAAYADDGLWAHPLLASCADRRLRADLLDLGQRLPEVLDRLDALPQAVPHGDASPQNLLQPVDEPDRLVLIDLSFPCPSPLGFDLGQLLVGLVHAGEAPASSLTAMDEVLVPAYAEGVRAQGVPVTDEQVRWGHHGSLLARAGFTSLPLERLHEPVTDELRHVVAERVALTRWVLDAGRQLLRS